MTLDLHNRKLRLIQEIMKVNDESTLSKIEEDILSSELLLTKNKNPWSIIKPIGKTITLEEMIKEQNYKPIDKKTFYDKVSKLKIEEPLNDLLSMLS